jgi:hypothetical protein
VPAARARARVPHQPTHLLAREPAGRPLDDLGQPAVQGPPRVFAHAVEHRIPDPVVVRVHLLSHHPQEPQVPHPRQRQVRRLRQPGRGRRLGQIYRLTRHRHHRQQRPRLRRQLAQFPGQHPVDEYAFMESLLRNWE